MIAGQHESVKEFIKVLGLDPKKVAKFTLHFDIDEIVSADIRLFIEDTEMKEISKIAKKYLMRLKEVEK